MGISEDVNRDHIKALVTATLLITTRVQIISLTKKQLTTDRFQMYNILVVPVGNDVKAFVI